VFEALLLQCRNKQMKPINRRENPRIEIKLRCYVSAPGIRLRSAMHTQNMSRNGLMVAWVNENGTTPLPGMGQIVTVEIELPAHHGFGPKCIHCQGAVTRISHDNADAPGVAIRLNYMDFRSLQGQFFPTPAPEPVISAWTA
jgi:hypothetical protein